MTLASTRLCARALFCALLSIALLLPLPAPAHASTSTTSVEVELRDLVNAERRNRGLAPLRIDVRLVAGSRGWSQHMAREGRLAHHPNLSSTTPGGTTAAAENVGATAATSDIARRLHDAFMRSAQHRAAILDARYTDLGIGIAVGHSRHWATQRFTAGAPARAAAAIEPTAALARSVFGSGGAKHAVIARDDVYADALSAGPLAGGNGPLLLTSPGPALHPVVRTALEQVLPGGATVWIVGGSAAVSTEVEREIAAAGWTVKRLSGSHRIETAERVARALASRDGRPSTALVATAHDWPDAVAGGAYGAATASPVLLTRQDAVPAETAKALRDLKPAHVAVLGGPAAVHDTVVKQLGARRVAGSTREGTSARIAEQLWGYTDAAPNAWVAAPAYGSDAWTWGLGAAPLAANRKAAVLLVGTELTPDMRDYLRSLGYGGGRKAQLIVHGPVPTSATDELRALLGN